MSRFITTLAVLALATPAHAQDRPPGPFQANQTFYQVITTRTTSVMKVQGQDITQTQSQSYTVSWTPGKRDGDTWEVTYKIVSLEADINIGGNNIGFKVPPPKGMANPQAKFFQPAVGMKFTLTVNDKLELLKIDGLNQLAKFQGKMQSVLDDKVLKRIADPALVTLPPELTDAGKDWHRSTVIPMGPTGKFKLDATYTRKERKGDTVTVGVAIKAAYEPPDKDAKLPFTIRKAEVKFTRADGEVQFNVKKGRVEQSTTTVEMVGEMTIDIAGMDTEVVLTQTHVTTVRTSDTDPTPAGAVAPPPAVPPGECLIPALLGDRRAGP